MPGVSSALAVPALAGIPLTHRTANQGFTVITGHVPPGDPRSMLDYAALARSRTALVIMMGVANLPAIADGTDRRRDGSADAGGHDRRRQPARPADRQAPLAEIAAATAAAGIRPPAITVIGSVAAFDPADRSGHSEVILPVSRAAAPQHDCRRPSIRSARPAVTGR